MDSPNFDDFFEPQEGENYLQFIRLLFNKSLIVLENGNEFDFIDTSILQRFQRNNNSIEKIQREIFNFDEKGKT